MASETKFKETEIGMIPEEWNTISIDKVKSENHYAVAMGPFGSNITKDNFIDSGVPVIRGGNIEDFRFNEEDFVHVSEEKAEELKASSAVSGDIVITHRGTLGQVGIIPENSKYSKYIVSQSQMKLTCNEKIVNPFFVYYFLKSKKGQYLLLRNKSQTGVPAIARPTTSLKEIKIPLPLLEEQNSIVDTLRFLDNKIELNRQMNKTLEQIAQTLFKHWFIDFEFPDENGSPYKSSGGRMVDSELGEIPEGWGVKQIGNICETFGGGTPRTKEPSYWENGDVFWATPTDMTSLNSPVIFDTTRKITEKGLQNSSAKLLPEGSILMTSRATLGYFAIAKVPITTNQGFISMVCDGRASNYYLLNAVRNKMNDIESLASGSTYLEINRTSFRSIEIILPPKNVMKKFDETVDSIYEKIFQNELETKKLAEIRDSLLPKLMSGKIRVQS